jgi:hypothetical protein
MDQNRKTNIPIKSIPQIVEWLLKNCSRAELEFMASLAGSRTNFKLLTTIFTRLTDYNIQEVFYEKFSEPNELLMFRASKRGEVAGLKAFSMACQAAMVELNYRRKEK